MIPEIKRDNEVLLTSNALALGEEIDMGYSFQTPTQNYLNRRDSIIAGSYLALGVVGSNPSAKTFEKLEANLKQTKQTLETGTEAQKAALTRERVFGDMFLAGVYGYYSQYVSQSKVMSVGFRVMHQSIPTAGTFGYEPYQRTLLGINRGIERHGVYMNVRTAQAITDRNGDSGKAKQLMLQAGMLGSELEHAIPEQMFADPNSAIIPEGFSTARALDMAMMQGQRIYTINQKNQATALLNLRLDAAAMDEIRSALASGKDVTTHTDQLTVPGFRGSGYAITDPVTGEGVYKISGGKNGSYAAIAASYRLDYGVMAWDQIRGDRTINEQASSYSEALRNAEHFLYAYSKVCDDEMPRAEMVILVYLYFIAKAIVRNINIIKEGPITIPLPSGAQTFDFRNSPVTWMQLIAGLHGAALGSECGLD